MDPARSPEQVGSGFQSLLETRAQLHSLVAERDALANQNERLPEEQLLFAFEEIEATLAGNAAEAGKASPALRDTEARRRRAGRGRLPAHLPRVRAARIAAAVPALDSWRWR